MFPKARKQNGVNGDKFANLSERPVDAQRSSAVAAMSSFSSCEASHTALAAATAASVYAAAGPVAGALTAAGAPPAPAPAPAPSVPRCADAATTAGPCTARTWLRPFRATDRTSAVGCSRPRAPSSAPVGGRTRKKGVGWGFGHRAHEDDGRHMVSGGVGEEHPPSLHPPCPPSHQHTLHKKLLPPPTHKHSTRIT